MASTVLGDELIARRRQSHGLGGRRLSTVGGASGRRMSQALTLSELRRISYGYADLLLTEDMHHVDEKDAHKSRKKREMTTRAKCLAEFHRLVYNFADSRTFSGFILFIVMLNTGMLVTQSCWNVLTIRGGWYFAAMDNLFLGIYIMEAVLKIYAFRSKFFKEGWNVLDLLICIFNLIDFVLPLIIQNMSGFDGAAIFRLLRIFRAIRAIRALRVLRTIRLLANLQVIMTTCLQSIQSMGAIVGLISLFMCMFAVIGRGLFSEMDPERFGGIFPAFFTLFQLLTLDDWFDIYSKAVKKNPANWTIFLYLLLYIVVEYFVFLNLFVAVLVDNFQLTLEAQNEAQKKRRKLTDEEDEEEEKYLTKYADDDSDNTSLTGSEKPPRKSIEEYYPHLGKEKSKALERYFRLLVALEYNYDLLYNQQRTIDMMIDMCHDSKDDLF